MAKTPITIAPEPIPAERPRRRVLPILSLIVTVPLMLPIVIDATALCYGHWRRALGTPVAVDTPTFDAIADRMAEVREGIWRPVSAALDPTAWDRRIVLGVAAAAIVGAMAVIKH